MDTLEPVRRVKPDPINRKGRQVEVIDTDFHFNPEWETLRPYLRPPFREGFKRFPGGGTEYFSGLALGISEASGRANMGVARDGADIIKVIDEIGVDKVIVSPGFHRAQGFFNEPMITAVAEAYNDFIADRILPHSDRIRAEIMINHRDAAAGAAEIRRVAPNRGFVGIYTEFGAGNEPIGSARHDPIFDAAAEFDLPVTIHVGGFWQQWTALSAGTRTWVECLGISSVGTCMAFVASLIMQGVFDKYPTLKIIVKEGGYWWLPEFMLRADDFYAMFPGDIRYVERKLESGEKYLRKMPSEYVREHFRFSTQPMCPPKSPEHFRWLLELCHADELFMYSSDWPHATFDPLNWLFENPHAISDDMQRKILSENARKLFSRL
jgi:predicted TIM-barrel fold metal-dependent hydrolase